MSALLALTGCAAISPGIPLSADDPRPQALLDAWERSGLERRALRGRARLSVDGEDGGVRIRAKQIVLLERPAQLRVEVLGLFSQTAAVLVTDGEHYQFFNLGDGSRYAGAVTPTLLWQFAHLALTPREVADVLLGGLPPDEALTPLRALELAEGRVRVDLTDERGAVRRGATFDAEGRLVELEVRGEGGSVAWRARYSHYAPIDGTPFAHTIELYVAVGGTRAEIELRDVELNPVVSPDMFRLEPPGAGSLEGRGEG